MAPKLARHGSNNGYRAHLGANQTACIRCHNAHLVYQTQYSKVAKAQGIKYKGDQILDHMYGNGASTEPYRAVTSLRTPETQPSANPAPATEPVGSPPDGAPLSRTGPSLAERISAGLTNLVMPQGENPYVDSDQTPDYLHTVDPDPEPMGDEWSPVADQDFVINAAGMAKIEENMGTYLSIVGMTAEMIDPYCGNILAENFDNIVSKWSRVVAHYPAAAKLFLDTKSGVLFAWIAALQSTWPVLMALYHHHFARDIVVKDGVVYERNVNGARTKVDATMPPMADFDYTAA